MKVFWILVAGTLVDIAITVFQVVTGATVWAAINGFCGGMLAGLAVAAILKHRWEERDYWDA